MIPFRTDAPSHGSPAITMTLIVMNVAVYFYLISLSPRDKINFIYTFALVPAILSDPAIIDQMGLTTNPYLTLITNTFMHGGALHLIFNLWTCGYSAPHWKDGRHCLVGSYRRVYRRVGIGMSHAPKYISTTPIRPELDNRTITHSEKRWLNYAASAFTPLMVKPSCPAEIATVSPSLTVPSRMRLARGFCKERWITRFKGRAP